MKKYIFILLSALVVFSCKENTDPDKITQAFGLCLNVSKNNLPKERGAEYADFRLLNRHIIMSDGFNDYLQVNRIKGSYITTGPVLEPTNGARQIWLGFDNEVLDTATLKATGMATSYKATDDQLFLIFSGSLNKTLVQLIDSKFQLELV